MTRLAVAASVAATRSAEADRAGGAVAEHERGPGVVDLVEVGAGRAVGCVDVHAWIVAGPANCGWVGKLVSRPRRSAAGSFARYSCTNNPGAGWG